VLSEASGRRRGLEPAKAQVGSASARETGVPLSAADAELRVSLASAAGRRRWCVFQRYNIIDEKDLNASVAKLAASRSLSPTFEPKDRS
jgi:hypothetical protein